MVKRCLNGQCVDHPEECKCPFCEAVKNKSVVVTEQGMFGDLSSEYEIDKDPSVTDVN